jgi:hypothetical protein
MAIEMKWSTRWGAVLLLTGCALAAMGCGRRRAKTPTNNGDYASPGPTPVAYTPPPPSQPSPQPVAYVAPAPEPAAVPDADRKPAARAAYTEGVRLQEEKKYADALARFETAQKFFDAPTHLLHIAECQVALGRLVEASESYEVLARKSLPAGSPDAFVEAQRQGKTELGPLRARVPTLRVTTKPDGAQLQGLQVNVNGVGMPAELLGIPRPLNPGLYRLSATARGYSTASSVDVPLGEKEQKSIELVLVPSGKR